MIPSRFEALIKYLATILVFLAGTFSSFPAIAQIHHEVFLPNTDHELNVYRISGEKPGKTIMIIGGIQGDEPGGYLTADLYADIHLKKGNLIVVPRANFYSILLNRREGATGDMNRKFGPENHGTRHLEEEVVTILKHLIAESDCLLNLHEGSGYYAPEWIDNQENPDRYGQSIIYDAESYRIPGQNRTINLGQLARTVVRKVNAQIDNSRHHFRPNNHDTINPVTRHPEQRLSATFYALTSAHIPAFGVETSKSIKPLETKIRLHKLVINTFMEEFGILPDSPGLTLADPELDYVLIRVNNGPAFALQHADELRIDPGDEVLVSDIIANYQRGLVADIVGVGTRNDTNIGYRISRPTRVVVRKDAQLCGWIDLTTTADAAGRPFTADQLRVEQLLLNVNDRITILEEGEILPVRQGNRLILLGVRTNISDLDGEIFVNFKGFAPPKLINDGNDLYFPIHTDKDLWQRYSVNKKGRRYPIVATYKDRPVGRFWVELVEDKQTATSVEQTR